MSEIYRQCYAVLRPGGILALVLKGFTRDGQYVDLPGQTAAMVEGLGFIPHDHWRRQLWSLSFWRTLQRNRDPRAFDERLWFEDVMAWRKPEGGGGGVDLALTSPPYEGTHVVDITTGRIGDNPDSPWKQTSGDNYTRPCTIGTGPALRF